MHDILGPHGALAQRIPGYAPRAAQQDMADVVAATLQDGGVLIAEAGTGTGKTYAYLVPALLSGKRVIVTTGTKNLQDQIFHRDLPTVRLALGAPVRVSLLKGRANYLCLHRLELSGQDTLFRTPQQGGDIQRVRDWARRTRSGDIAELAEIPEDASVWPQVTSTGDNCLGQQCPKFSDCFLTKARREAQAADIVGQEASALRLDSYLTGDTPRLIEGAFGQASGRVELRRSTFYRDGKPHQLLVFADLSRALREEQQLAWQRIVRGLSHEIKNSLTPVKSSAHSRRRNASSLYFRSARALFSTRITARASW